MIKEKNKNLLQECLSLALENYEKKYHSDHLRYAIIPEQLKSILDLSIDENGGNMEQLENAIQKFMNYSVNTNHPLFMNQMYGHQQAAAIVGDILTTLLNTSIYTYEVAPVMTLIEKECIQRLGKFVGYASDKMDGIFTPGGSISNMTAMVLSRDNHFKGAKEKGLKMLPSFSIFISEQAHYSFLKGSMFLGMGKKSIVKIKTDKDGKINILSLCNAIEKEKQKGNIPLMLVGVAGTTVAGVFDDMRALASISNKENMWFHVDAAYGASLLFSKQHSKQLSGIHLADSITWNLHKMMGIPLGCSALLTKHKTALKQTFDSHASYLFHDEEDDYDLGKKSLQCGRRVDVLKLWFAWLYEGDKGFEKRVNQLMEKAILFAIKIKSTTDFKLFCEPSSPIVCFQYHPFEMRLEEINTLNKEIRTLVFEEGKMLFNYSKIGNKIVLRCVISNPNITSHHFDQIIENIREKGHALLKKYKNRFVELNENSHKKAINE